MLPANLSVGMKRPNISILAIQGGKQPNPSATVPRTGINTLRGQVLRKRLHKTKNPPQPPQVLLRHTATSTLRTSLSAEDRTAPAQGLFVLIVIGLWLLLLLDDVLLPFRRFINQRGSMHVFVGMFGKYQPSLCHVQERKPGFRVRGFASKFDALSGVYAIQLDTVGG